MKKFLAITAILLGLTMTTYAQGGLFHRGVDADASDCAEYSLSKGGQKSMDAQSMLGMPSTRGGDNDKAPVGSGLVILAGLGAAYMIGKKRK